MEYIIDTIEGGKFECKLCEKVRSTTQIKGHLTETYDIKPVANVFWQALKRSMLESRESTSHSAKDSTVTDITPVLSDYK